MTCPSCPSNANSSSDAFPVSKALPIALSMRSHTRSGNPISRLVLPAKSDALLPVYRSMLSEAKRCRASRSNRVTMSGSPATSARMLRLALPQGQFRTPALRDVGAYGEDLHAFAVGTGHDAVVPGYPHPAAVLRDVLVLVDCGLLRGGALSLAPSPGDRGRCSQSGGTIVPTTFLPMISSFEYAKKRCANSLKNRTLPS